MYTWRSPTKKAVVDLGAQWIENAGETGKLNPIFVLAQQLGIATVVNECVRVRRHGHASPALSIDALAGLMPPCNLTICVSSFRG